jgi:hypothetical protein
VPFFLLFLWSGLRVHLTTIPEESAANVKLPVMMIMMIAAVVDVELIDEDDDRTAQFTI